MPHALVSPSSGFSEALLFKKKKQSLITAPVSFSSAILQEHAEKTVLTSSQLMISPHVWAEVKKNKLR